MRANRLRKTKPYILRYLKQAVQNRMEVSHKYIVNKVQIGRKGLNKDIEFFLLLMIV